MLEDNVIGGNGSMDEDHYEHVSETKSLQGREARNISRSYSRKMSSSSLQRQFSSNDQEDREIDYFELFCAQAGRRRRLSSSRDYGGSLPCIAPELSTLITSCSPQDLDSQDPAQGAHLTVPLGNQNMRRAHSDCGTDGFSQFTVSCPPETNKSKAMRIWSSIKSLVDSCEGSPNCLSPAMSPPFERFGHLDMAATARCSSAPHSRCSSIKRKRKQRSGHVTTTVTLNLTSDIRPRAGSFPNKNQLKRPDNLKLDPGYGADLDPEDWQRVRHFVITPKGFINCGDSFRSKSCSSSLRSLGSNGSGLNNLGMIMRRTGSQGSVGSLISHDAHPATYKVLIRGGTAVGKTTLTQQFLTSECLVEKENLYELEDCTTVTVLLDSQESRLQIEEQSSADEDFSTNPPVDAILVVFSTIDRNTFQQAQSTLSALRRDARHDVIVLVANKIDLVRNRQVAEQEGKSAAATFDCKYFEVSALMSLRVDELLAGVVNQIRLHRNKRLFGPSPVRDGRRSPMRLLNKILKRQAPVSKSCDNLLVL